MAKARKDLRGRALRKGEMQRSSDKRYVYRAIRTLLDGASISMQMTL